MCCVSQAKRQLADVLAVVGKIGEKISILEKKRSISMSRKERRAKARREKVENLHKPIKANSKVLIIIAVITAVVVIGTYFIRYSGS